MKTEQDLRTVLTIVEELKARGTRYAESIGDFEWKRRGWPSDRETFDLVNAILKANRELEHFEGTYQISIVPVRS